MWKEVVGYEGIYEVNNKGEVRTCKNKTTYTERHGIRKCKQRVLKQKTDRKGYKRVTLYKDGKPKTWLVHRLVALSFLDKPLGKEIINHKDGTPDNNIVENLEWCDHKHNLHHALETGLNNMRKKVVLQNNITGDCIEFKSRAHASRYLGKNEKYISYKIIKGKLALEHYTIKKF